MTETALNKTVTQLIVTISWILMKMSALLKTIQSFIEQEATFVTKLQETSPKKKIVRLMIHPQQKEISRFVQTLRIVVLIIASLEMSMSIQKMEILFAPNNQILPNIQKLNFVTISATRIFTTLFFAMETSCVKIISVCSRNASSIQPFNIATLLRMDLHFYQ